LQATLQTIRIRKEYPGTLALDDVSVQFQAGKVSALLGKNGAGKSTLVKILAGTTQPSSGEIHINGKPIQLNSATDAFAQGIATVYQELSLIPQLSVAENILLGRMPRKNFMIDWKAARKKAQEILAEMGVEIDVRKKISQLGVAQQQIVEIAKAMSFSPSVLMLDEPTSALAQHETQMLFKIVRCLASKNVAIIYITHRLQELASIADTVTVLRDGKHVGTVNFAEVTADEIVRMIFGSVMQKHRPETLAASIEPLLEVKNLSQRNKLHNINFTLHCGEVLGIAGMLGSGRTELLRGIFGADPVDGGEIVLDGQRVDRISLRKMKRLGLGFTPENRKEEALVLGRSVRTNLCLASLAKVGRSGFITRFAEQKVARRLIDQMAIKVADSGLPIASLSGGNQQKVVVGKWLNTQPRVMLFDEPTRGIDLQAKQQIFQIIWDLSRAGIGCIFVSSELEELLEVCHRILIMKNGALVDEVRPEEISVEQLVVRCMRSNA
jgi:ribose transport system ATP-binding protein